MKLTLLAFAGLQSLLTVQSSYQLSKYSGAALALTYQPAMGLGMQVTLLSHPRIHCTILNVKGLQSTACCQGCMPFRPVLACCMTGLTALFGQPGYQSVAIRG